MSLTLELLKQHVLAFALGSSELAFECSFTLLTGFGVGGKRIFQDLQLLGFMCPSQLQGLNHVLFFSNQVCATVAVKQLLGFAVVVICDGKFGVVVSLEGLEFLVAVEGDLAVSACAVASALEVRQAPSLKSLGALLKCLFELFRLVLSFLNSNVVTFLGALST